MLFWQRNGARANRKVGNGGKPAWGGGASKTPLTRAKKNLPVPKRLPDRVKRRPHLLGDDLKVGGGDLMNRGEAREAWSCGRKVLGRGRLTLCNMGAFH